MLGVSGTTQYINPDYIQPLPTSLDTKNSPLALLAQTCSSIGKDNSPTSASSSSSSSSSLLSSSSSSSTSKLSQHQQIHSSSTTTSDKKDSGQKLLNGKDQSSRLKSSDPNADHNGVHQHHNHHHHSSGSSYNHYKMSSGKSSYSERLSKENGRSSTGRLSTSPPKNKLSSGNGYGLNGNKNHLSKSDAGAYRGSLSYYGNGKEEYIPGSLPSVHHHHHHQQQQQQQSSKLSPSSSSSPLQSLKMQQELFSAAFGMGYPPWMLGQSPFMPPAFDPFFLSAAALSSQHKQHLLQLHQQLFSSISGYPSSEPGSSGLPLGGTGQTGGSSQKHDTDAGHSPTSKSSTVSHNSPAGSNPLLPGASLSSLFPAHIPGHSSSQGQQLSPSSHPYACNWLQPGSDFCGKRFSTYEELLEHLKTHVAGASPGQGGTADEGRLFPTSFFPFMFGMAPPFALPSGYNSSYLLQQQQQQQQQQAAAASLFQRSYSPSTPSSSSSSLSTTSSNSRYHPYKQPALSSASVFPSLLPFPTPSSSTVASQFSSLMPPYMGYGFPYPMYGGQKLSETAAGP